jgi:hypothetical protein
VKEKSQLNEFTKNPPLKSSVWCLYDQASPWWSRKHFMSKCGGWKRFPPNLFTSHGREVTSFLWLLWIPPSPIPSNLSLQGTSPVPLDGYEEDPQGWICVCLEKLTLEQRWTECFRFSQSMGEVNKQKEDQCLPLKFYSPDFNAKKLSCANCESLMKTNTASQMTCTLCSHQHPTHSQKEQGTWAPLLPLF